MRRGLGGIVLVAIACAAWGHPLTQHSRPPAGPLAVETPAYVHVARIGGAAAGRGAAVEAQHVTAAGLVQVSFEETRGQLQDLRQGRADTSALFEEMVHGPALEPPPAAGPGQLSEYRPARVEIVRLVPEHGYVAFSEVVGELRPATRALADAVAAVADRASLTPAEAGLWVRAYRVPPADEASVAPDVSLRADEAAADPTLVRLLEGEMALVRVGAVGAPVVLGARFTIVPGRPVHARLADRVYVFFAYRWRGAGAAKKSTRRRSQPPS